MAETPTKQRGAATDKPAEGAKAEPQKFIADEFTSAVFVHGSTDPGTGNSLVLTAGDPIPPEALEALEGNPLVPVTGVRSRKARLAEEEQRYLDERAAELRALGAPGATYGSSGSAAAGYDPALHSVEEVKEYLKQNPEHFTHVRDLELAGKNRREIFA